MDLDFAELFTENKQDALLTLDFARNHVYAPLRRIVDALNSSDTKLDAVNVLKTITVGRETIRVLCSLSTPLSLNRLESAGGIEKEIRERAPPNCSLTMPVVYEALERKFSWNVEFEFDDGTRRRLLEADAAASAAAAAGASITPAVEVEKLVMPADSQHDKERLLRERRALEEASRLAEAKIRSDRTDREIQLITSARGGGGGGASRSLIRRTTVAPSKQLVVKTKRAATTSPTNVISKKGNHTKAKLGSDDDSSTLIRPNKPPSFFAFPVPFLNRLLCFIGGVDSEGSNLADADYAKSHAYDTDLFVQTH